MVGPEHYVAQQQIASCRPADGQHAVRGTGAIIADVGMLGCALPALLICFRWLQTGGVQSWSSLAGGQHPKKLESGKHGA